MSDVLEFHDLEKVYDWMALAIDKVGSEKEALFLSKLCITLAHNIGEVAVIEEVIRIAQLDL